ncbi:AraC family transcriptional regulator [Streptococcus henryi]|uniref:AraC family transcriptional regulator n=1 Tax=Streptococcus henryi TaxID=439219 RepID=UPI00037B873C|nr:AraC family transcriptional regulator [Streptococcus henryi]
MSKHEIVVPENNLPAWIYLHEQSLSSYIEPHWHSSVEISYTMSGHIANFFIAGQSYVTSPGTILVVNSTELHSIRTFHEPDVQARALTIIFPYHIIKMYKPTINHYRFNLNNLSLEDIANSQAYQCLQEKLDIVASLYDSNNFIRKTVLLLEILEIMLEHFLVERTLSITDKHDGKQKERLNDIKTYIEENYKADIDLEDIAKFCYLSKEHLARFFKEQMDITVFQYLNYVRAKHAKPLLLEGKLTATQVALECGFSGLRTMDRALIKNYGLTSRDIRKKGQSAP